MMHYKLSPNGGALMILNGSIIGHALDLDENYIKWLKEGNIPEPAETDAETLARLQAQWRAERDRLMREADLWELLSFQSRYGVTQQQVVDYKAQLYDVPGTIAEIENFAWPARPF